MPASLSPSSASRLLQDPRLKQIEKEILDSAIGKTTIKAISAKYGYHFNTILKHKNTVLLPLLKVATHSNDEERKLEARQKLDWLFKETEEALSSVKKGPPVIVEGKTIPSPTNPQDILRFSPDHKAWASILGAAERAVRLLAELDQEIGPRAAAKELASQPHAPVVALLIPSPDDPEEDPPIYPIPIGDATFSPFDESDSPLAPQDPPTEEKGGRGTIE